MTYNTIDATAGNGQSGLAPTDSTAPILPVSTWPGATTDLTAATATATTSHTTPSPPGIALDRLDYALRALIRDRELADALGIGSQDGQSQMPLRLLEADEHLHALVWDAVYLCQQRHGHTRDRELLHTVAGDVWERSPDYQSDVQLDDVRDLIDACYAGDTPDRSGGRAAIADVLGHYLVDRPEARAWEDWGRIGGPRPDDVLDRITEIRTEVDSYRSGADRRGPFLTVEFRQRVGERVELISGVLVARQLAVVGAATKSLKTLISLDAAISIATGTPWLGYERWSTGQPRRVMFLSAESGAGTLIAKHDVIAMTKRRQLMAGRMEQFDADLAANLLWDEQVPDLGDPVALARLCRDIEQREIEVVFIDPLSMAIGSAAKDFANFAVAGQVILRAAHAVKQVGATLVLVHHTSGDRARMQSDRARQPLDLTDLGYTAVSNHARQWITINRAEAYDEGLRRSVLWLRAGGSGLQAGGTYRVTIDEGYQHDRWDVLVSTQHEAIEQDRSAREIAEAREDRERRGRVLGYIRAHPGCSRDNMTRDTDALRGIGDAAMRQILPDLQSHGTARCEGTAWYAVEPDLRHGTPDGGGDAADTTE